MYRCRSLLLLSGIVLPLLGCSPSVDSEVAPQADSAHEIAKRHLIVDTHIDAPYRLYRNPGNLLVRDDAREFDVPRAFEGGLNVVFMSIYTPASAATEGTSRSIADELIDMTLAIATESDEVGVATCTEDVYQLADEGKLAFALGMENGSPLEGDVSNLGYFIERGIRYITLAHSRTNEFSDSSYDENEPWEGLSPAGKELVNAMQQRGIMIDLSHLTDRASWQVLEMAQVPVFATHSSLRHFIPGFHRNIPDDMVVAVAETGGVVQLNFGSGFVSEVARQWSTKRSEAFERHREQQEELTEEESREFFESYKERNPYPFATIDTVVDHIDHVVELTSIDHVGLGSDFDGVGDTLPISLKSVADYPNLVAKLLERGYSEEEISKILGGNTMRVWQANEKFAEQQGNSVRCTQETL